MRTLLFISVFLGLQVFAEQNQFNYRHVGDGIYKCINSKGEECFNENLVGECGQVSGKLFLDLNVHDYLSGLQAQGSRFHNSDFSRSGFNGSNLTEAYLGSCLLNYVHVRNSIFQKASITLNQINFIQVYESNFSKINAFKVAGIQAYFSNVDLTESNFSFALLEQFYCSKCNFSKSNLYRFSLRNALISDSQFSFADLVFSNFSDAIISNTQMDQAKLDFSSFNSATLSSLSFQKSRLLFANFIGTRISEVNFTGADLRGANFTGATLIGLNIWQQAQFDDTTKLPFSESQAIKEGMIKVQRLGYQDI